MSTENDSSLPQRAPSLEVWDALSLIVGIVVGVAIFKASPAVFKEAGTPLVGLTIWGLGALLAFNGALCYCELATTYPQFGAEYVYLTRAYGRRMGFLFAWMQTCAVITGSIGIMAFVVADYVPRVFPGLSIPPGVLAGGAVALLVSIHIAGVKFGKGVQNLLTALKVISLGALLAAGLFLPAAASAPVSTAEHPVGNIASLGLALVFVLFAYGGWNDVSTVTPEVRDYRRNMPRVLLGGLSLIALLYMAINWCYLRVLGFEELVASQAPAADLIERTVSSRSASVLSAIVVISALGAIHGMLFAGCRLLAAVGQREPMFRRWNEWSARGVPVWAMLTLGGISLFLIALFGTDAGRGAVSALSRLMYLPTLDWKKFGGGFGLLLSATAPIFWTFFALAGLSLIVLRVRDPQRPRPFRVPLYPITPLLFVATSIFMCWSALQFAGRLTLLALPVFVVGVVLSFLPRRTIAED